MTRPWIIIGLLGGLGYLTGIVRGNELLMQFSRILPHIAFLRWWWVESPQHKDPARFALLLALLGCTAGDYILRKPQGFIAGVFGFLLAQLSFTAAFLAIRSKPPVRESVLSALPFGAHALGLVLLLWPNLGEMRIPVAVYGLAIASMGWRAWLTRVPAARIGAILFIASDSLLALEKFHPKLSTGSLLRFPVILTYWSALALLLHSSVKQPSPRDSAEASLRLVRN
jgi:uncharacterized membrane protein YhhN